MKRFLLFAGDNYYPGGGWDDFISDHDALAEALAAGKYAATFEGLWKDWWHVVDTETGRTIQHFDPEAEGD